MAKSNGLSLTTLSIGDATNTLQDIRNDITNFTFTTPRGVQDVTGLDKAAKEALLLLADFSFSPNAVFHPAANFSHVVFSSFPATSVARAMTFPVNLKNLNEG